MAYQEGKEENQSFLADGLSAANKTKQNYGAKTPDYRLYAELIPDSKTVIVDEYIYWKNKTGLSMKEIQFTLPANAYKNSNTEFAKSAGLPEDAHTSFTIEEVKTGNTPARLEYTSTRKNPQDSTSAKVVLSKGLAAGDSITVYIKYKLPMPRAFSELGYAGGREFYFLSGWYPRIAGYDNGKWDDNPRERFGSPEPEFNDYYVELKVPMGYEAGGTGLAVKSQSADGENIYEFNSKGIKNFAWFASDKINLLQRDYISKSGSVVKIKAFIQPENKKYINRYFKAISFALEFLNDNIGKYPFKSLTLMDQPRTSFSETMEFPALVSVRPELFSPVNSYYPEFDIVYGIVRQYFNEAIRTESENADWMDKGVSLYLTEKIMEENYGLQLSSFKLFGYYPIFGLNFLSYNEIPLIYTLGNFKIPHEAFSLFHYYQDPGLTSINDTVFSGVYSREIASLYKPELMMVSLERVISARKLSSALSFYYDYYKFKNASPDDLISIIKQKSSADLTIFFDEVYYKPVTFDYKITGIVKGEEENTYKVGIRRKGEGVFRQEVFLYTDKDTLSAEWDGKARWKEIKFKTKNKVVGAKLDPRRMNVFDLNYADNSYMINEQYAGSVSLSLQYFFWMQNLLLVLGSVG